MRVVFKNSAIADIEAIGDYVKLYNPMRAPSIVEEIRQHAIKIGDFPELYPVVSRFGARHIRRCVHSNYLIFYRIARNRVEVLQVLHGATNFSAERF